MWYAPFGIQAIGDRIFVTYAWRAPVNGNDAPKGGYVDEFDLDGRLVAHVGRRTDLDEPWGVALAPKGFGRFGGDLLVANFGTGAINAYAREDGGWAFRGALPVKAPGVWGIAFGNGAGAGPRTTLFYAAGPHRWHGASEVDVHGVHVARRQHRPDVVSEARRPRRTSACRHTDSPRSGSCRHRLRRRTCGARLQRSPRSCPWRASLRRVSS